MTDELELCQDYRPTDAEFKKFFDDAMNRMKDRYSFIFTNKRSEGWLIGTWSMKNTNPMYVRKHGTESDKEKLPPLTKRNRPHK